MFDDSRLDRKEIQRARPHQAVTPSAESTARRAGPERFERLQHWFSEFNDLLGWRCEQLGYWVCDHCPRMVSMANTFRRVLGSYGARAAKAYTSMCWAKVALLTSLILAALFTIDSVTGHLSSFTIIYMLPIWLAARVAGGGAGFFAMVLVGALLSLTDAGGIPLSRNEAAMSFAIRWIGLGGFLISILHIENALKAARLRASHDPLTGLANRIEIESLADAAIRASRNPAKLHVGVLDCDDFKALNDVNGHAFGDHALRVLARRLESVVKDKGRIGRMGGDEFVVLFDGVTAREARLMLERAHTGYRRMLSSLGAHAGISYGLATCGKDGDSFERLCRVADERMYGRKRASALRAVVAVEEAVTTENEVSAA